MKIRVGVFFGGRSVEHEVSVISALQAVNAFDRSAYEIIPVYITKENEFYTGPEIGDISKYTDIPGLLERSISVLPVYEGGVLTLQRRRAKKFGSNTVAEIDVVFPIVHGTNVEDGALQGFFQTLRVPYAGCSVLSSAVGMDKYVMKTVLRDCGLPVLPGVRVRAKEFGVSPEDAIKKIESASPYPVIVKPVNLGSSVGIKLAHDEAELRDAAEYAFGFASEIIVERAVTELREINCSVLGNADAAEASECEEPVMGDEILSYEDKYGGGSKNGSKGMSGARRLLPAPIDAETRQHVRELAVEAFRAIGCCGVARIDFLMDRGTGEIWVNEINTIPGSLSFYLWEASGMKYPELLDRIVRLALEREREREALSFSLDTNILSGFSGGFKNGAKGGKR